MSMYHRLTDFGMVPHDDGDWAKRADVVRIMHDYEAQLAALRNERDAALAREEAALRVIGKVLRENRQRRDAILRLAKFSREKARAAASARRVGELTGDTLRETLADIAHSAWSGWMEYLFSKCYAMENDGQPPRTYIPREFVERWMRQMQTPYADLPENEKESDRAEADEYLDAIRVALGAAGGER